MATADETVTVTQFTDPMCTWCWGSEPILRHLRTAYGDRLDVRFVMGGLVENFETFYDATNDIADPGDVAPHWLVASERHGMPVDTAIFDTDPAQSTYSASVAFAAARQQDRALGHRYLRRLREASATEVRNVNRRDEQIRLAEDVGLDVDAFTTALDDGSAREAFETDLARTRRADVRAFPTYRIAGPENERRLAGFQPFADLSGAVETVAPSLSPSSPPPIRTFVDRYAPLATQEVAEVYGMDRAEVRQALAALTDEGAVRRDPRGNGLVWHATGGAD
jgi:predicted DsbA family dithiol-disulfide isomerase